MLVARRQRSAAIQQSALAASTRLAATALQLATLFAASNKILI